MDVLFLVLFGTQKYRLTAKKPILYGWRAGMPAAFPAV
jgi:hypothetical protein